MSRKGTISVKIDDSGFKAYLLFKHDESAEVCTSAMVSDLLKSSGIKVEIESGRIEEFITALDSADEEFSFLIAEGKPPVPPGDGKYEWHDLTIPEELLPDSERLMKTALDPEVFEKKSKKVKVQKKVLQKARFPLGKEKEKIVTVIENRTVRVPVEVNPEIVDYGWIDKGKVLAEKTPASGKGTPGIKVTGEDVPPGEEISETVYPGKGVKEEDRKLIAEYSGFVRRGENWVDIIPFQNHFWEIVLSKDKSTPLLNLTTGDELASPPFARSIVKKAVELGFSKEDLISEEKISQVIDETISSGSFLKDFPLTRSKDASFSIKASPDRLKGFLTVEKGSGNGKPLKLSEVGDAIKKSGFTPLNYKKIKEDLVSFYRSGERELKDYILVEGKPPGIGEPPELKLEVEFLPEKEARTILEGLKKEEDDLLSVTTLQRCAFVDKDAIVASLSESKPGPSGKDIFQNVIPGIKGELSNLNLLGHLKLVDGNIVSQISGVLFYGEDDDGAVYLKVFYDKKRALQVEISDDAMEAYLTIQGTKGTEITEEMVRDALQKNGVIKGIDESRLEEILQLVKEGGSVEEVLIAKGSPPANEEGGSFKLLIDLKDNSRVSIKENGKADYKNQDRITVVAKGAKLGIISSAGISAEDGWDVTGKVLPAQKRAAAAVEIGENIAVQEDDKGNHILIAESGGELHYDSGKIYIEHIHTVKGDIDLKEGNVKFPGSVKIGGSVNPGFFVMAEGDIQIAGSVNAALISSGESIIIGQGVVGGGKAVLRSKKDIDMAFAEQAVILAVGTIRIKNSCLRCRVKCNGKLSLISDKGDLIGGEIKTTGGVIAHNIGNKSSVKTQISFGQNYLIQDQIEKEERELEKIKAQITKLDSIMHKFEKEGEKKNLIKAGKQKVLLMKSLEKKGVRLFALREKFEEHFESEIIVRGTLFPGVVFESHGRYYETKREKKNVRLFFDQNDGRIVDEPLNKGEKE